MTNKPPRYVRVWRNKRYVRAWEYRCEFCGPSGVSGYFADQVTPAADIHARTCPAVAAAMERDQLRAELDTCRRRHALLRERRADLEHELAGTTDMLTAAEAELDRMRTDRDRLRDRIQELVSALSEALEERHDNA